MFRALFAADARHRDDAGTTLAELSLAVYRGLAIPLVTAPSDEAALRRAYLRFVAMLEAK